MKPILEIKNVSKKFSIGSAQQPYLSLRDSLASLLRPGGKTEEFWALKDVSFTADPGETIGIIGKNGAGKSTLLKILSRITPPTSGSITCRGRIASLLEVGTGFHPELNGRENILMNGSILGMKRKEIRKNFDAIVDFAGVEKFIDTPLKHYSSGMQLRLAFAVAAFLENEILIIDEVLAVGDAEFQKKCMGKMEDVSRSGRTVLFVSHNIGAVNQLCKNAILLESGTIVRTGNAAEVSNFYLDAGKRDSVYRFEGRKESGMFFTEIFTQNNRGETSSEFLHNEPIHIVAHVKVREHIRGAYVCFALLDKYKQRVFSVVKPFDELYHSGEKVTIRLEVPGNIIAPNRFSFLAAIYFPAGGHTDWQEDICPVTVVDSGTDFSAYTDFGTVILHDCKWSSENDRTN